MSQKLSSKRALTLLLIMVIVDAIGLGLLISALTPRLIQVTGSESGAALWTGILFGIDAIMRFIFNPIVSAFSDRVGRRPILILAALGSLVDYAVLAFVPELFLLVITRTIGGITNAYLPTIFAYFTDVSEPNERVQGFGLIGAAFGTGFVIGPAVGGLLGGISLQAPFLAVIALVAINLGFIVFLLPESLKLEIRQREKFRYRNPVASILEVRKYGIVAPLSLVLLLLALAEQMLYSTWFVYTGARYDWGTPTIGLSISAYGLMAAVMEGVLVGRLVSALGKRRTILFSLIAAAITYALFGLAPAGWMIFAIIPFAALGYVYEPPIRAVIAANVPGNQQGTVQGALGGITSLAAAISPLVGGALLSYLIGSGANLNIPGGTFFLCALFSVAAVFVTVRTFAKYRSVMDKEDAQPEQAVDTSNRSEAVQGTHA